MLVLVLRFARGRFVLLPLPKEGFEGVLEKEDPPAMAGDGDGGKGRAGGVNEVGGGGKYADASILVGVVSEAGEST